MYKITSKKFFRFNNNDIIISFISILCGLISGTVIYILFAEKIENRILDLFLDFYTIYANKTSAEVFSGIALSGGLYLFAMFICGGSFFGSFLSPFLTFIKSTGLTLLVSNYYCEYALKGLEYTLLVFFPGKSILLFGMLLITKNCICMSRSLIHSGKDMNISNFKNYCIKSLAISLIFIVSWITDFACIRIFTDLFDFN